MPLRRRRPIAPMCRSGRRRRLQISSTGPSLNGDQEVPDYIGRRRERTNGDPRCRVLPLGPLAVPDVLLFDHRRHLFIGSAGNREGSRRPSPPGPIRPQCRPAPPSSPSRPHRVSDKVSPSARADGVRIPQVQESHAVPVHLTQRGISGSARAGPLRVSSSTGHRPKSVPIGKGWSWRKSRE